MFRSSPIYDHPANEVGISCGFVVLRKWMGAWFVLIQTIGGDGRVLDVAEHKIT